MRRKCVTVLIVLLLAVFLNASPADAYSETDFSSLPYLEAEGYSTIVTDLDGRQWNYSGILNADTLQAHPEVAYIRSYEICCGGKCVLSVSLHDIEPLTGKDGGSGNVSAGNGYYATEFSISSTKTVFLTGLTARNLFQVQNELVAAGLANRYFSLTNLDFIDAEKDYVNDSDLCWAASAADLLQYTGWGSLAGFDDEDEIFETLTGAFYDTAGNPYYGIGWFFNGVNLRQETDGWAHVKKDYGSFTGYLPAYAVENVLGGYGITDDWHSLGSALNDLRAGCGASLCIGWYSDGVRNGGHLISLWGYVEDSASNGKGRWPMLIVSDSDSDITYGNDRRDAPNRYRLLAADAYRKYGLDTFELDYSDTRKALLDEVVILEPYQADVKTESGGSRDKFVDPDLAVSWMSLSTQPQDVTSEMNVLPAGQTLYAGLYFRNVSGVDLTQDFGYRITVADSKGKELFRSEGSCTADLDKYQSIESEDVEPVAIGSFSAGTYTVTVTADPGSAVREAYESNNTGIFTFTVRDTVYDLSGAGISLQLEGLDGEGADAVLSYSGLNAISGFDPGSYILYFSYLEEDGWSNLEPAEVSLSAAPASAWIDARGSQVKAVLIMKSADASQPGVVLESAPVSLAYQKVEAVASENCPEEYTAIPVGADFLADGEQFAFTVRNTSTMTGTISYQADIVLSRALDGQEVVLAGFTGSLARGEESAEYTWNQVGGFALEGIYDVTVRVTSAACGEIDTELGTLEFEAQNVSFTELSSAMRGQYVEFSFLLVTPSYDGGTDAIRVEYGLTEDSCAKQNFWGYLGSDDISGSVYRISLTVSDLTPGETYLWRPVFESEDLGTYYGAWQTVTLPALGTGAATLKSGQVLRLAMDAQTDNSKQLVFTPTASGYYKFTVDCETLSGYTGYFSLYQWDEDDGYWSYIRDTMGGGSMLLQLNAWETAYFSLTGYIPMSGSPEGVWDVSVLIEPYTDTVTEYQPYIASYDSTDPFNLKATAAVKAPLGSDFTLYLDYKLQGGSLSSYSTSFYSYYEAEDAIYMSAIPSVPGKTYQVRSRVIDKNTNLESASGWTTIRMPSVTGPQISLGEELTLTAEPECSTYCIFTAPKQGTYYLSCETLSSYGGAKYCRATDTEATNFAADSAVAIELGKGETLYIGVHTYYGSTGTYRVAIRQVGAVTGSNDLNNRIGTFEVTAQLPDQDTQYELGIEYYGSTCGSQENPLRVTRSGYGKGIVTDNFTTDIYPGYVHYRAVLILPETGEKLCGIWEYCSQYEYQMTPSVQRLSKDSTVSVDAPADQCLSFDANDEQWYELTVTGQKGTFYYWNTEKSCWDGVGLSSGKAKSVKVKGMGWQTLYFWLSGTGSTEVSVAAYQGSQTFFGAITGNSSAGSFSATLKGRVIHPFGTSFKAGIVYGTSKDELNYVWQTYKDVQAEAADLSFDVFTMPGQTYNYRAVLVDAATGDQYYGDWKTFRTASGNAGSLDANDLSDSSDSSVYRFTATEDGLYTVTATGSEGTLQTWLDGAAGWTETVFDSETRFASLTLQKGDTVYLRQQGLGSLVISQGFAYAERSYGKIRVRFAPEQDGTGIAAVYDKDGRMLAVKTVKLSSTDPVTVEMKDDSAAEIVKVMCVDADAAPESFAMSAAIPE